MISVGRRELELHQVPDAVMGVINEVGFEHPAPWEQLLAAAVARGGDNRQAPPPAGHVLRSIDHRIRRTLHFYCNELRLQPIAFV